MSNQTKIGLLMGLGVILLVGIIVSDHLASAQNQIRDTHEVLATLGETNNTHQPGQIRDQFLGRAPASGADAAFANPVAEQAQLPLVLIGVDNTPLVSNPIDATPGAGHVLTPTLAISKPAGNLGGLPTLSGTEPATPVSAPAPAVAPPAVAPITQIAHTYTVKSGDVLSSIAEKTLGSRSRWPEILEANKEILKGGAKVLRIGTVLTIPGMLDQRATAVVPVAAAPAPAPAAQAAVRTYTVVRGDVLGHIAQTQLGSASKVDALVAANKKALPQGRKTVLKTGMVLAIPAN